VAWQQDEEDGKKGSASLSRRAGSFGGTPKARQPLMSCLLSPVSLSRSHVHTSGTKPAFCLMWFLVIIPNGQPAKNIFPLIRQKTVLEENKVRGNGP
jgi:hypothetical protein